MVNHEDVRTAVTHLKNRGFAVMAANLSERSVDYRDHDFTKPTCVLLGQELDGVTEEAIALADGELHAPMHGMVESLNVSVAAAVMLFEAQRQRTKAGFFSSPRLDPDTYRRALFQWAQPDIADYCDRHDFEYPALNEIGELAEPLPRL